VKRDHGRKRVTVPNPKRVAATAQISGDAHAMAGRAKARATSEARSEAASTEGAEGPHLYEAGAPSPIDAKRHPGSG
jgi:hypothetical protein